MIVNMQFFKTGRMAVLLPVCVFLLGVVYAQEADSPGRLKYNGAPGTRDLMLQDYSEKTGRTLLLDPKLPQANIVLKSQTDLTIDEYLEAIERSLRMNGIELVPVGDKFLKVVPVDKRPMQEGMQIRETLDDQPLTENGKLVSQMVTLKSIEIPDAIKAIEPFKHTFGFVHALERSNSILITDTAESINRMVQIIKHIDQPVEAREVPNVVQVKFAKASEIKAKLEEIIKESQDEEKKKQSVVQSKSSGQPGFTKTSIPGVIRAQPAVPDVEPVTQEEAIALAERGVIRGKVQIVADDRTNILIILTRIENMAFFDQIIQVLDVATAPDVTVKIFRLEFSDAEEVAKMLNELVGKKNTKDATIPVSATGKTGDAEAKSAVLSDYVSQLEKGSSGADQKSKIGELSADNIKILADKRTNAMIIMASESDMKTLELIITDMDMMVSQVLIEAVIIEVGLDNTVQSGIDWVQRSMVAFENKQGGKKPLFGFAGGGGGGSLEPIDTLSLASAAKLSSSMPSGHGLTYYFTQFGLNLDVILSMSASDTRSHIISSPVIVTHDNKEATIESSKERYFYKGKRWVSTGTASGTYEDDVESRKVSLKLTVTPHINRSKLVVMEIAQTIEELGTTQPIGEVDWPTMNTREMKASIAVQDHETIVLGGLVKDDKTVINKGIPYLRKIPLIGALFRSKADSMQRSEIVVFITPYVLDTPADIKEETARRKETLVKAGVLWEKGWSDSSLADPTREQKEEAIKKEKELLKEKERQEAAEKESAKQADMERKEAEKVAVKRAKIEKEQAEAEERKKAEIAAVKAREEAAKEAQRLAEETEKEREAKSNLMIETDVQRSVLSEGRDKESKADSSTRAVLQQSPLNNLDSDLAEFIKEQEKRWEKTLDKIDKNIEKEMLE